MFRRDRIDTIEAKAIKLSDFRHLFFRIDLVDDQEYGFLKASQEACKFMISGCYGATTINDKEDDRCMFNRNLGLFEDSKGDLGLLAGHNSARVDNLKKTPVPIG